MHDGFLCRINDGAVMKPCAEAIFKKVVSHKPLLKRTILAL